MSNTKNTWKEINLLINGKSRGDHVITALRHPGNGGLSHTCNADEMKANDIHSYIPGRW